MKKKAKKTKICKTCYGYGLWNDDSNQPMGPMDAADGFTTKPCPECGKCANTPLPMSKRAADWLKKNEAHKKIEMDKIHAMSQEQVMAEIYKLLKELEELKLFEKGKK